MHEPTPDSEAALGLRQAQAEREALGLSEVEAPAEPRPGLKHLPVLDGLRGTALLLVLLAHVNLEFGGSFAGHGLSRLFSSVLASGWMGVDLFFVLSGFLITRILLEAKGSPRYFRTFYSRRILRIFPLYYGYLFSFFVLLAVAPRLSFFFGAPSPAEKLSLLFFFYNLRTVVVEAPLHNFHVFWSLAIEEHFYLLWPLTVFLLRPKRLLAVCVGAVVFSLALRGWVVHRGLWLQTAYLLTPCRLDGLATGALLAIAHRTPELWARVSRWALPVAIAALAGVIGIGAYQGHFTDFVDFRDGLFPVSVDSRLTVVWGLSLLSLMFGALLVLAVNAGERGALKRLFEWAPLRSIGKYSFAMYVFHTPLLIALVAFVDLKLPGVMRAVAALGPVPAKLILFAVALPVIYAAGWLSYRLYERRFLELKRRVEY